MGLVSRAFQIMEDGYGFFDEQQRFTPFSALRYCQRYDGLAR